MTIHGSAPAASRSVAAVRQLVGNTGISFAALGAALGHPVRISMPDWMSEV